MTKYRWIPIYLLTAGLGLGLAYALSVGFMGAVSAQEPPAPSDGSLPPEFLNEIEGGSAGGATPPAAPAAAPPSAPTQAAPNAPPPPLEDLPPQQVPAQQQPQQPAQTAPPETEAPAMNMPQAPMEPGMSPTGEYVYDPTGRRDPFRPFRMIRSERRGNVIMVEPLQKYDLDQMSVVGILWDVRAPRALVRDSDGNMHTVVKNTKLGRNNGYVAAIREGELVVIETFEEEGKSMKRTKLLEFKK